MRTSLIIGSIVLALSLVAFSWQAAQPGAAASTLLDGPAFMQAFGETPHAVLLDVRTPGEFSAGHIAGADILDYEDPSFAARVGELPKDVSYFVYCRSGNRSSHAVRLMREAGITRIYELRGGIAAWPGLLAPAADDSAVPLSEDMLDGPALVQTATQGALSPQEEAGLVFMREEEKLARDVYTVLGDKTGLRIFANIAASEQTHMDAVGTLIARYGAMDPVRDDAIGTFAAQTFKDLYASLVSAGEVSDIEALRVGARIEELDIADLAERVAQTDDADIRLVYEQLMRGSRNHLRSFAAQLASRGATYEPVHLPADAYAAIVSTPRERGEW